MPRTGWLSPGEPDPEGRRLAVVREALLQHSHIKGIFWDFSSLFVGVAGFEPATVGFRVIRGSHVRAPHYVQQKPPGGDRLLEEDAAFGRSLQVMADLYASAVGTTVLQLKEIPQRPRSYDGALCLFELEHGADGTRIRAAFAPFGYLLVGRGCSSHA